MTNVNRIMIGSLQRQLDQIAMQQNVEENAVKGYCNLQMMQHSFIL